MKLKQHALSAAFPRMSDADFLALQDDIEVHGQRDPIVIFEGQVIDGWNRYQACIAVGLDPKTRTLDLAIEPVAFVKSYNLHRRHLNASQRAMAVVACSQWTPVTKTAAAAVLKESVRQQAADADVSERTIHNARAALKGGLKDAVNSGAMSVEQAAAVAKPPKKKETAAAAVFAKPSLSVVSASSEVIEYTDFDELHDKVEGLQDALAISNMGNVSDEDKGQAATLIGELRARIKVLEQSIKAITTSRDTHQAENAQLRLQINRQRREIDKATGRRTA